MPEQSEVRTVSIERSHNVANELAGYSSIGTQYLCRLERMTAEERGQWYEAAHDVNSAELGFKAMHLPRDIPADVIRSMENPEDWEEMEVEDIHVRVCSVTDEELYRVELQNANVPCDGYNNVTYVNKDGRERGGVDLAEEDQYISVDGEEAFISKQELGNFEPTSNNSSTLTAFYPDSDEKIHVEYNNGVIRDLSYSEDWQEVAPLSSNEEVEAIFKAIIDGDSEADALEGWVPLAAEADEGNTREMKNKVEEMTTSLAEDIFIDSPLLACAINTGIASGKRYVAVPEDNAEEVDELLFNPDMY